MIFTFFKWLKMHRLENSKFFCWWSKFISNKLYKHQQSSKIFGYNEILPTKFSESFLQHDRTGKKHQYFEPIFKDLLLEEQNWILNWMSIEKGVTPYEMLNSFELLDITPTGDFFTIDDFYSSQKNSVIDKIEHVSHKKLYNLLKMRNLGDYTTCTVFRI